jgi:hypothetical protein
MKEIALPLSILILALTQVPGAIRDLAWNNCVKYASDGLRDELRNRTPEAAESLGSQIYSMAAVRDCNGGNLLNGVFRAVLDAQP